MSVACTGIFGLTRPMKASPTSTSISSESMSTTVQMPVRVKPPPADSGETISPGCASLVVITPANGARTMVLSTPISAMCRLSAATSALRRVVSSSARSASRSATAWSYCALDTSCCPTRRDSREALASASCRRACTWFTALRAAASCEALSARCARASIGSSVASTWPSSTCCPSSIRISRTRPVILAETVAMRRATT